jgi:hypothetical protein
MSSDSNNQNNEEIDLGQLFNAIGKVFDRFINFIASIFKSIFSAIIYLIKDVILNFKIIVGVMLVAGIIGFGLERMKKPVYSSQMVVKTYFESKYQLVTNVNYFNALLADKNYTTLSGIFDLNEDVAKELLRFSIESGPETENDRIVQYDRFVKSIDSTRAIDLSYEDFIENRDIHSGDLFIVKAESFKKDIFKSLEPGFKNSFSNVYSTKKMNKRDSLLEIQKLNLEASLEEIKQLKKVYIDVLEEESQSTKASISLGEGFPLQQEKSETKEYQLLDKEINIRNELRKLEERKVDENVFFDVISGFQLIGNKTQSLSQKYSLVFPALAFVILVIVYFSRKTIKFVLNYE